jgi:hypothetical protein
MKKERKKKVKIPYSLNVSIKNMDLRIQLNIRAF